MVNRVLGLPFWIAATIQQHRMRREQRLQQARAYHLACLEAARATARRRPQLSEDIDERQATHADRT